MEEESLRYSLVISQWDPQKGEFKDSFTGIKEETYGPPQRSKHAFTFRKLTGLPESESVLRSLLRFRETRGYASNEPSTSEVDVHFPPLQKLLGRLTYKAGWPEEVTKRRSPYAALIHSWDEAQREASKIVENEREDDRLARNDLKELLKIISTSSGSVRLDQYFKDRKTLLDEETITFQALWTLFPPGTLVLAKPCHDEPQVFFIDSCSGFVSDDDDFIATCYCNDWNGSEFLRVAFQMTIKTWGGDQKKIAELPFYPLKYYDKEGMKREDAIKELKSKLIQRGRKYRKFCEAERGKQMFTYSEGDAYFSKQGGFLQNENEFDSETQSQRSSARSTSSSRRTGDNLTTSRASWKPVRGSLT